MAPGVAVMAPTTVIVNMAAELAIAKSACSSGQSLKFSWQPTLNA